MSQIITLSCDIDIEQNEERFYAGAIPDDVGIEPGDIVILHATDDDLGEHARYIGTRSATLIRAGFWQRNWVKFSSIFQLTELFEVGFQP